MAPKKNYTKDQLNAALDAIARGMPVATAAKTYSVPRVTLLYKSTGKLPVECRMGPSTVLTSVVSLKSINEKSSFKLVENDISTIKFKDILEKLPQPKLHNVGDRIKYDFSKDIDIFEA